MKKKYTPYPWTDEERQALKQGDPLLALPGDRPREFVLFHSIVECHDGKNPTCVAVIQPCGLFCAAYAWRAIAPVSILNTLEYEHRQDPEDNGICDQGNCQHTAVGDREDNHPYVRVCIDHAIEAETSGKTVLYYKRYRTTPMEAPNLPNAELARLIQSSKRIEKPEDWFALEKIGLDFVAGVHAKNQRECLFGALRALDKIKEIHDKNKAEKS